MASHHRANRKPLARSQNSASAPATAREVAATVLLRVVDQGAYAMQALDSEIQRARLSERDAALATEIVYGSLRVLPELDAIVAPRLKRGLANTDGLTLAVLRAAAYQLAHLGRVPTHAIVDGAVGFIRRARGRPVAGFVNAVLRKLAVQRPEDPQPATRTVVPEWLYASLAEALGAARTQALLELRSGTPPVCLCVPHGKRQQVVTTLTTAIPHAQIAAGDLSPDAVIVRRAGDPRRLPGFAQGGFWVQEEGAQLVGLAVGAAPGEQVADLCAGHGGKTLFLANRMGGRGGLTSADVDEAKLALIPGELSRLGLAGLAFSAHTVDLTVGLGGLSGGYDRVLVDAPCAGLGTLHRRPELLLRLAPADLDRMASVQLELLSRACQLVRPGGSLTYAVCSLSRAEGAGVAAALEGRFETLRRTDAAAYLPDIASDSDGILRIGPWLSRGASAPDGYQVVSWDVTA